MKTPNLSVSLMTHENVFSNRIRIGHGARDFSTKFQGFFRHFHCTTPGMASGGKTFILALCIFASGFLGQTSSAYANCGGGSSSCGGSLSGREVSNLAADALAALYDAADANGNVTVMTQPSAGQPGGPITINVRDMNLAFKRVRVSPDDKILIDGQAVGFQSPEQVDMKSSPATHTFDFTKKSWNDSKGDPQARLDLVMHELCRLADCPKEDGYQSSRALAARVREINPNLGNPDSPQSFKRRVDDAEVNNVVAIDFNKLINSREVIKLTSLTHTDGKPYCPYMMPEPAQGGRWVSIAKYFDEAANNICKKMDQNFEQISYKTKFHQKPTKFLGMKQMEDEYLPCVLVDGTGKFVPQSSYITYEEITCGKRGSIAQIGAAEAQSRRKATQSPTGDSGRATQSGTAHPLQ